MERMVTKRDMDKALSKMHQNTEDIRSVGEELSCLREEIKASNEEMRPRVDRLEKTPDDCERRTSSKEAAFFKARRSLRIWPIAGTDNKSMMDAFLHFTKVALKLEPNPIMANEIEGLIQVRNIP